VRPDLATLGTGLRQEVAISHHNTTVLVRTTTLPFFDPERRTSRA
jgi:aminomethyltransferase